MNATQSNAKLNPLLRWLSVGVVVILGFTAVSLLVTYVVMQFGLVTVDNALTHSHAWLDRVRDSLSWWRYAIYIAVVLFGSSVLRLVAPIDEKQAAKVLIGSCVLYELILLASRAF